MLIAINFIRNISNNISRRLSSTLTSPCIDKVDPLQLSALKEKCIVVNENDQEIGSASKEDCHRVNPKTGECKLHRAFSVFLFNKNNELLLHKRSSHKVTFPNTFTNACCSHPLFEIESEREEKNAIGVKRAAQRRLNYELGIPLHQVNLEDFQYLTRIYYSDAGDGIWGEHEIDYILFLHKNVDLQPNANEVSEIRYVRRDEFDSVISTLNAPLTPWFQLIQKTFLKQWWDNLHDIKKFEDHQSVKRFYK